MKILVTSGATREPVDGSRFLSIPSSGRTGAVLSQTWSAGGHRVVHLAAQGSVKPQGRLEVVEFGTGADLEAKLREILATGTIDAVVHAAAVTDFRAVEVMPPPGGAERDAMQVKFVAVPRILPRIKGFAPNPVAVVGFKLTLGADLAERRAGLERLWQRGGVDWVVHNDAAEVRKADVHPFHVHASPDREVAIAFSPAELARLLGGLLES